MNDDQDPTFSTEIPSGNQFLKQATFFSLTLLMISFAAAAWEHRDVFTLFALPKGWMEHWMVFLLLPLLILGTMVAVSILWKELFPNMHNEHSEARATLQGISRWGQVYLVLLSAVTEEVFFRGILQGHLGVVVTSLLVAILHMSSEGRLTPFSYLGLIGSLLLGVLYTASASLLPCILTHFAMGAWYHFYWDRVAVRSSKT